MLRFAMVSAFLTVWTIQRTGDLAVMRALGATRRTLVSDVLTQGLLLLLRMQPWIHEPVPIGRFGLTWTHQP